jgi:hypothetical protein
MLLLGFLDVDIMHCRERSDEGEYGAHDIPAGPLTMKQLYQAHSMSKETFCVSGKFVVLLACFAAFGSMRFYTICSCFLACL